MAQLTHDQYDALERAVTTGRRIAVRRSGRREDVIIPLALRQEGRREVIEARHPTTGHALALYVDEIEGFEVVS